MHLQTQHIKSYVLGQLPEDLFTFVDSHIRDCAACGSLLLEMRRSLRHQAAGDEQSRVDHAASERRRNVRVATGSPAGLTVLNPPQPGCKDVTILDVSRDGLKLAVPDEILRGTIVQVHMADLFIMAEVRYCRQAGEAFHVGVLIQSVFAAHRRSGDRHG